MRMRSAIPAVLAFNVAGYVEAVRAAGRQHLDPALRGRMAELYEDLQRARFEDSEKVDDADRPALHLAELVLETEWQLAAAATHGYAQRPDPGRKPRVCGKGYRTYANLRLLNTVLGTRHHSSDQAIERRCWRVVHYLTDSWLRYEQRSQQGLETWCQRAMPSTEDMDERVQRLARLVGSLPQPEPPTAPAAGQPPRAWSAYLGPAGRANTLEYLASLPQTRMHDEYAFLRVLLITEATTWGMVARVMAAVEWLKAGEWAHAALCLDRACRLAAPQLDALLILRRTMSVERFLGFRTATGEASAIQSIASQLLQIYLVGVQPKKLAVLSQAPESTFLLLHLSPSFEPLRKALHRLPRQGDAPSRVLATARKLDGQLFQWRRVHLGMAHRYLPKQAAGSGGTSGASYLQELYEERIFSSSGNLLPQPAPTALPDHMEQVFARPPLSPLN